MVRKLLFVPLFIVGCADDGPSGGDDEVGDTGGSPDSGPGGPGCEENWIAHDGVPVADGEALPEYESVVGKPLGELVEFHVSPRGPLEVQPGTDATPSKVVGKPLPFDQFVHRHARRWGSGWIMEGDQYLSDEQLEGVYQRYVDAWTSDALALNNGGIDEVWSPPRKLALTWCVGTVLPLPWAYPGAEEDHEENYTKIVRAMESAAREWERVADVNFVHLREFDTTDTWGSGACQPGESGIWFRVRMGNCGGGCFGLSNATPVTELQSQWATPENPKGDEREMLLWWPAVGSKTQLAITAMHELGHVLGFEHEHERFDLDDLSCNAFSLDPLWRSMTPADPLSVMGYDNCEGIAQNQPRLSPYDRVGAFYQYTWARRHALMMGGGNSVKDLAYDGSGRAGIAWFRPWAHEIEVWTSVGLPGAPLDFDIDHHCLSGGNAPCVGDETQHARVRPSPLFASGTAADLDVLLLGPGNVLEDEILTNTQGQLTPSPFPIDGYVIPVIGSFEDDIDDELLLYRPGPAEDTLIVFGPQGGTSSIPVNYPDYSIPLPGRYRGFGGGGNDILWYQPDANALHIWRWQNFEPFEFWGGSYAEGKDIGFLDQTEYVPILGDFNGDNLTDLFWYAPGPVEDSLWQSVSNQDAVLFERSAASVDGEYRPFPGDFDGDGIHDILWYSVADELDGSNSVIWYFDEDGGHEARTFTVHGDYTPVVGDFDADGCSDVLWYHPTSPDGVSLSWRCVPGEREFACDAPLAHPTDGYPLGNEGAY